jgi:hypothetical protein
MAMVLLRGSSIREKVNSWFKTMFHLFTMFEAGTKTCKVIRLTQMERRKNYTKTVADCGFSYPELT